MLRRLGILVLAAVALAGCGGDGGSGTSTTAAPTTTTTATTTTDVPPDAISFRTFFVHDGALVPLTALVPPTKAIARAALEQLLNGPPGGHQTAIPPGTRLQDVAISEDGIATASFTKELGNPTRTAQAQIVSTLDEFPAVRAVRIEVDGKPVPLQNGSGDDLTRAATRADYGDLTPEAFIFVRTPERDSTVTSPVQATGAASVFEGTLGVEIWKDEKRVGRKTITASAGAPDRGTWSARLALPKGDVRLVFFEPSAEDGSHKHETEVLLHVQ